MLKPEVSERTESRQARLDELYMRNAPSALMTAYFLTGNRDLAEDLVQEAFVRVTGRFEHLRTPDAFPAYLRRTIVNLFTSQLRRRALERDWIQRQPTTEPPVFVDEPETRDELWQALAVLPPRQRAAVVLRYYEDLPEREAARVLGCSTGALHQLVTRATTTLRDHLSGDDH
jgi:RNA polymerase sigma-70 factor (sigma-E family)